MSEQLRVREFIINATHRWPVIVLFCLLGSLFGWGISFLLPPSIRATTELYVGLNIDSAVPENNPAIFTGPRFINADDYKNWQMANLNALVYKDEILDDTLARLRALDSYWEETSRMQLRKMLHVYWRNAGKWRLVAEGSERLRVTQAVMTWQTIIIEHVHQAITASEYLMSLEKEIQSLSLFLAQKSARKVELIYLNHTLQFREEFLAQKTADQPLSEFDRWSIWQPAAQADLGNVWNEISEGFPAPDSSLQEYIDWIAQVNMAIKMEIHSLDAQIESLEEEKSELLNVYSAASKKSLGLSVNLQVDRITEDLPEFSILRPTSVLVLIGTMLGFLTWIAYWLVVYSRPRHNEIQRF